MLTAQPNHKTTPANMQHDFSSSESGSESPHLLYAQLLDPFGNSSVRRRRVRDGGKRNKLSFEVVLAIFERRPNRSEVDGTFVPCAKLCRELSAKYNVQARTIRDIWNRRSWGFVTAPLWTLAEIAAERGIQESIKFGSHEINPVQMRKRGRPHGAKDTVKRRRKTEDDTVEVEPDTVVEVAEVKMETSSPTNIGNETRNTSYYQHYSVEEGLRTYSSCGDHASQGMHSDLGCQAACSTRFSCEAASRGFSEDTTYPLWDDNASEADCWNFVPLPPVTVDIEG